MSPQANQTLLKLALVLAIPGWMISTAASDCGGGEDPVTLSPEWSIISDVNLTSGGSSSLDLDAYVYDPDTADSALALSSGGGSPSTVTATIDSSTHVLTLTAASSYTGTVSLLLYATDPEGNQDSTSLKVQVAPASTSSLAFVSLAEGSTYINPVSIKSQGSADIARVVYSSPWNGQTWTIGESSDAGGQFPLSFTFDPAGSRQVKATGYTSGGTLVASASVTINVQASASSLTILEPADGGSYQPAVTFKASGSSDIAKVQYYSTWNGEKYLLGESSSASSSFSVSYTFNTMGDRTVEADGLNSAGTLVASDTISFTVATEDPGSGSSTSELGAWLWYIEGTEMTHTQLADKLKSLGVKRIYVKVGDGTSVWPEANDSSIPDIYQARGIQTWGWSYNYPGNTTTQASVLTAAAKAGYDGYVMDIESEFDGASTTLESLMSAFYNARQSAISAGYIPNGWRLYSCSWGNPKDHNMRVDIMDKYVDGHMPQSYLEVWGDEYMADPAYWVEVGTQEYRSLGATKPIHHVVSTEYDIITASQINAFFAASGPQSSIWRIPGSGTSMAIWDDWAKVNWGMFGTGTPDTAKLKFLSPTDGGAYTNPVTMKVSAASTVARVKYYADGYYLGESTSASSNYPVTYTFSTTGTRTVDGIGYDSAGTELGRKSVTFNVSSSTTTVISNVPYYYQYNNSYNPSGSCQNTSVAMILSYYGCTTTPDTISAKWGTSYAQTPSGLAEVFNYYAAKCAITQRLKAHSDGVISEVNALLRAGKPVIVHGYFTSYGHVLPLIGYDGTYYTANDPAGKWTQQFKGGYYASDSDDGKYIKYGKQPVIDAIATWDGYTVAPIWYHEVTP